MLDQYRLADLNGDGLVSFPEAVALLARLNCGIDAELARRLFDVRIRIRSRLYSPLSSLLTISYILFYLISSHLIPSRPVPSRPVPSHPISSQLSSGRLYSSRSRRPPQALRRRELTATGLLLNTKIRDQRTR